MASRPERRAKSCPCSYDVQDAGWRLSVSDNGSGPKAVADEVSHAGLALAASSQALAHQLEATVQKTSGPQGTTVTIAAPAVSAEQQ